MHLHLVGYPIKVHGCAAAFVTLTVLLPGHAPAETKVILAEGTYTMGDGESPVVAEARALHQAKRLAVEQAGTYVASFTQVKNYNLTADELEAVSAGIMEVEVLEKHRTMVGAGIRFDVKIRAAVTLEKTDEMLVRLQQKGTSSWDIVGEYKKLKEAYARLDQDMDQLKKQFREAKSEREKQQILNHMSDEERKSQALEWWGKVWQSENLNDKINYLGQAIRLVPTEIDFWSLRGAVYSSLGEYEHAISDYTEAIRLHSDESSLNISGRRSKDASGKASDYMQRAAAFCHLQKIPRAMADFDEAIRLAPNDYSIYRYRGECHLDNKNYEAALGDFTRALSYAHSRLKVVQRDPQTKPEKDRALVQSTINHFIYDDLAGIYVERAEVHLNLGHAEQAVADLTQALRLRPDSALALLALVERGIAYDRLGQPEEALRDFRRACELGLQAACDKLYKP